MPEDVQWAMYRTIPGLRRCEFTRLGYAIEYDYFPPTQLNYTLETKLVENLYFAGQINGTTGYEEAACQGLMAGINAVLKIQGRPSFVLNRTQAYIGVLIDDLVTKGVDEPYRMFTSRAEYRILLRQDNADVRLTPLAHEIGLASDERMRRVGEKMRYTEQLSQYISSTSVLPSEANEVLEKLGTPALQQKVKLLNVLLRPEVSMDNLFEISQGLHDEVEAVPKEVRVDVVTATEIQLKYQRYIEKEQEVASRILKFEDVKLPVGFDYFSLPALSYEAREKLSKMRPSTIGQASRISGVSPADVSVLLIYFQKH